MKFIGQTETTLFDNFGFIIIIILIERDNELTNCKHNGRKTFFVFRIFFFFFFWRNNGHQPDESNQIKTHVSWSCVLCTMATSLYLFIFFFFEIFWDFCFFEKQWPPTWWIKPNQDPCKLELCIQSISRVRHFQIYIIFKSFKHVFKVTCWLIKLQNKTCLAYVIPSSPINNFVSHVLF